MSSAENKRRYLEEFG